MFINNLHDKTIVTTGKRHQVVDFFHFMLDIEVEVIMKCMKEIYSHRTNTNLLMFMWLRL